MTNKEIRLQYAQETGDNKPFQNKKADINYVEWLEETLIDLWKKVEINDEIINLR
jgi:hypothetical protein